jgi:N-acetylneuraminic acid mutarotase
MNDRSPHFRTAFLLVLLLFGLMPGLVQGGVGQDQPDPVMGLALGWTPVKELGVTPPPAGASPQTLGGCSWTASTVYPITVLDQATAAVGGNLYVFGGVSTAVTAASNRFDGTTWTAIAPLPAALEFPTAVSDGTNIYILGGALGTGIPQTTLYRYNVAADNYTTLAPFTTGTWNQAAVYLSGKIYKFGGTDLASASTNVLEIYDVASNTWSLGAVYPLAISFVSAWTDGTYVYGAGGIQSVGSVPSLKTYRYNTVANTWDDAAIADLPLTRWAAATTTYTQGAFTDAVLAGGYVNGTATANISNTAISWDLASNTWSSLPNMVGERARMTGAVRNGLFYVVGGRSVASSGFVGTNSNQEFSCTTNPIIDASTAVLVAENCTPANGAIDPGEFVTVSFCVTNRAGSLSNTSALVGTLQASGGVTSPGAGQAYGVVIAGGSAVCRDHTFVADPALSCGAGITATLALQDGALNLGTVTYNLGTGALTLSFDENFDGVIAPALPLGWTATVTGNILPWVTTTTTPDTAPNAAFVNNPATVGLSELETPPIALPSAASRLTFRNKYITESTFDGGVLEIKIGAGAYADIVTAGGSFVSGGYNATLGTLFSNPLAGRNAWSGTSAGGYINTVVNLPPAASGQTVQLKWRMGSDASVAATGWWIDGISIANTVCSGNCPPVPVELMGFTVE